MFNKFYFLFFLSLVTVQLSAQFDHGCDGVRYVNEVFTEIEQETFYYGKNILPNGDSINLFVDVFQPVNDDADARPLILLAHGGAFIGGSREGQFDNCERFARMGYVAASMDYRLLNILNGIPDSIGAMDIALKASHDMKGALRWFRQSVDNGNAFNIDPDMFFIGGYSAGAITALIAGTLDEEEVELDFMQELVAENGGFEGNTGDAAALQYDVDIQGIYSMSGAIYDTSWIDINDPVISSFHGDSDQTVSYGAGYATVFFIQILPLHGSGNIIQRTNNLGVSGYLHTCVGGDHTDIYTDSQFQSDRDIFIGHADTIFAEIICNGALVSEKQTEVTDHTVYPNPAAEHIQFTGVPDQSTIEFFDASGRKIKSFQYLREEAINVEKLGKGIYTYRILGAKFYAVGQFVVIE